MKLFQVDYMDDCEDASYLTVGEDADTVIDILNREVNKVQNMCSCYMGHWVSEIAEVDGYKIIVS